MDRPSRRGQPSPTPQLPRLPAARAQGYPDDFKALFRAVYAAIVSGSGAGYPTFDDGLEQVLVGEAIAASARLGQWCPSSVDTALAAGKFEYPAPTEQYQRLALVETAHTAQKSEWRPPSAQSQRLRGAGVVSQGPLLERS